MVKSTPANAEEKPVLSQKDFLELAELHTKISQVYSRISQEQPVAKVKRVVRKREVDPNRPKHPTGAFLIYSRAKRASIVQKNPNASPRDIAIMLGEHWRSLDAKDRQGYVDKANINRGKYIAELAKYEAEKKEKEAGGVPADADDSSSDDDSSDEQPKSQSKSKSQSQSISKPTKATAIASSGTEGPGDTDDSSSDDGSSDDQPQSKSQPQPISKPTKATAIASSGIGGSGGTDEDEDDDTTAKTPKKKFRKQKNKDKVGGDDETPKKRKKSK
ncbi:Non-histone chromosomal protein 6 [Coemansia sp. RSA 988]|nr:Non-histone chromosomal protein 6 [Coemansia sp. RSA 988]